MNSISTLVAASVLLAATTTVCADPVIDWNKRAVEFAVAEKVSATAMSRHMALVHVAVFEAVNAISRTHAPYRLRLHAPSDALPEAAAAAAAHAVLVGLYPGRRAALDDALAATLQALPESDARREGAAVGTQAAAALLDRRANDGASTALAYSARRGPGFWVPPAHMPALTPHWGMVEPWVLESAAQFRPPPPPAVDSARQARDYDETYRLGGKLSTVRSAEQADVARLWITPGVPTWNPIARQLAVAKGLSLQENARLFALLAMASADALTACWDAKFTYHGWRPVDAIRSGGVPGRAADPAWESAVPTPPFPGYPSGHACFSAAAQVVLESEFGTGEIPIVSLDTPTAPGVTRRYRTLAAIVAEMSNARIWGGIHWRTDQEIGEALGREVGRLVVETQLRPQ